MSKGALLLSQIAEKTQMLEVACDRCDRRGRLSVARLIGEHGPDMPMPDAAWRANGRLPAPQ